MQNHLNEIKQSFGSIEPNLKKHRNIEKVRIPRVRFDSVR